MNRKVADHLANERTFLAWVRTVLAILAFGVMIERVGNQSRNTGSPHHAFLSPSFLAGCLTMLGMLFLILSLCNYLTLRSRLEQEHSSRRQVWCFF